MGILAAFVFGAPGSLRAQSSSPAAAVDTETAINRDETNPLGTAWLLKLESNSYLLDVEKFHTRRIDEVTELQPRATFSLTDDLVLVTRPTVTLVESTPYETQEGGLSRAVGFGDIQFPFVLTPNTGPSWLFAAGPTFVLPTATSHETGKGKWQAGPAAIVGWRSSDWLVAAFAQQWWSFAGSEQRNAVSELQVQYFLTHFFPGGWSVGMSPTVIANWKADGRQQLTFPFGLGVGKVVKLSADVALKLGVEFQYMPIHPDEFGREMNLKIQITPVVPPPIHGPLFARARSAGTSD